MILTAGVRRDYIYLTPTLLQQYKLVLQVCHYPNMYLVIAISRTSHTVCYTHQVTHVALTTTLRLQASRNGGEREVNIQGRVGEEIEERRDLG